MKKIVLLILMFLGISVAHAGQREDENQRFFDWIASSCPITTSAIATYGTLATYRYTPAGNATAQQITDAVNRKAAFGLTNADWLAWQIIKARLAAQTEIDGLSGYQLRGLAKIMIDEINALRQRDVDRSADVAAATSLANLQTRWAARSALNDRTLAQAKAAYKALMDGTGLDE